MSHGIFIKGVRPKSKKAVKEAIAANPERVEIENTSLFGGGFGGLATELKEGQSVTFVGPDPSRQRNFYGEIKKVRGVLKVT
jgi:hypothetical protein